MVDVGNLRFLKDRNFIGWCSQERRYASPFQFVNFSWWQLSAIMSLFGTYLDHWQREFGRLGHCAKFVCDWCVASIMWNFQHL